MDSHLEQFVRDALGRGLSRDAIRAELARAHWRPDEIEAALAMWVESELPVPLPRRRVQPSAREGFLHLVLFAALNSFAFNTGAALFSLIDRWVKDPIIRDYGRGDASDLRWSIAGVVAAYPVFLLLSRMVNRMLEREPEKRLSGVRRWLTYLTLYVAALVLIGNVTVLVSGYLSGDLTLRFALKSAVVFVIAGLVFIQYLGGIRREEADAAARRGNPWIGRITAVGVTATLIASLIAIGPPGRERGRRLDERRTIDLRQLSSAIESYASYH
ncbi:MAG: DUF5671 domain-containing protein, partial [Candidatus Eiseniibacteriota bacterium]